MLFVIERLRSGACPPNWEVCAESQNSSDGGIPSVDTVIMVRPTQFLHLPPGVPREDIPFASLAEWAECLESLGCRDALWIQVAVIETRRRRDLRLPLE